MLLWGHLDTWKFQVFSGPVPMYMQYPGLNFPKQAAFLSASGRSCALPPFGPCEEIGISFIIPMKELDEDGFLENCFPSSPLSDPFNDSEHDLVRFATKKVWKIKEFVLHQSSLRFPCSTRDTVSIFRWIWFLACASPALPGKEHNLRRRELLPRAFSTILLSTGPKVSTFCIARFESRTRSAESCSPHSSWRAFLHESPSCLQYL